MTYPGFFFVPRCPTIAATLLCSYLLCSFVSHSFLDFYVSGNLWHIFSAKLKECFAGALSHSILCLECYTPTLFGTAENDGWCYRTEYLMNDCKTETPGSDRNKTMQNLQIYTNQKREVKNEVSAVLSTPHALPSK